MAFNYTDLTSGRTPDLSGEKLEDFEDSLLQQVQFEIDDAESYLDETIRPKITENWQYYLGELPAKRDGEPSFTDNTCQATVDHYVAACMDAFTSGDSLEVVPDGITNPVTLKVINQVMNDVLDSENNRHKLYQSFFRDSLVSSASVLRPKVTEETKIDKEFFSDVEEDVITMRKTQLELSGAYEDIEVVVTEKKTVEIESTSPANIESVLGTVNVGDITAKTTIETYSGYYQLVSTKKTIKIDPVPAENFLINRDARGIENARMVGHKAMTTISELLKMGFDYDKVLEVHESCNDDDASENIASMSRKGGLIYDTEDDALDVSQQEVELYELYIKSSAESDDDIGISKLYQVFYAENVLLSYQETDEVPYSGTSPIPRPHMFWGDGMVDRTKAIQRAKTGMLRQTFVYNEMASKPRFEYLPKNLENVRDIFSNRAGAGIAVTELGSVRPIQITAMVGDPSALMAQMDTQREQGTGMSFSGQGLMGDVLKAGASTQSAAMVLSEAQMVQKNVIQTLLQGAIIPLVSSIYNMLRENFDSWNLTVDGSRMTINPNDWPELSDVRIKTPLGTSAKLEQSQKYGNLAQTLASAAPGTELSKLATAQNIRDLMVKSYELMDVADAQYYMPSDQEIAQKDQLMQGMQQMQAQMQQLQAQLQQMQAQNTVLQQTASQMAQAELSIKQQEQNRKDRETDGDLQQMADDQIRKEQMDEATMESMADKNAVAERQEDRKDLMVDAELKTGENLFRSI